MKRLPMQSELVAFMFQAGHGTPQRKAAPIMRDDEIATRIHRELMEKDPGNLSLPKPDIWKVIRNAVRCWRQKLPPEGPAQAALFRDLDRAKEKGVIR